MAGDATHRLQGWSLPLSPCGRASLVPRPPWHFSGDAIGIDFRADPDAVAAVLPEPLEPVGDGSASFVFCDWSSAADEDPRIAADPARGQYKEAYVAVQVRLDGRSAARVPYIWVDNDLSLARGHIQGFPKKFGTVSMTKAVSVGWGGPRVEPGSRFVGQVSSLDRQLARGAVTLQAPADPGFVPKALRLPVWHTRLVPDLAGGEPLVHDLARNVVTDFAVADVWTGRGDLEFYESEFEELAQLRPVEILGAFRCSVAFTVVGAEIQAT
ncbi:MAG TPA: acetoacetate decarboxylase family protein [Jatrophihabitantaceae bacterium]|jgi:acetoacetate decarboxylase